MRFAFKGIECKLEDSLSLLIKGNVQLRLFKIAIEDQLQID